MEDTLNRVERDERGPRTRFEDFEIGAPLGELIWSVSLEQVAGLLRNDQDHHPWYLSESPFGHPVVPPMATYPPVRILFQRKYNVRGLFYVFESEFLEPLRYDEVYTVSGEIADKWIKRDREYVSYEARISSQAGIVMVRTRRAHVLDYLTRDKPRKGRGIDSGVASS